MKPKKGKFFNCVLCQNPIEHLHEIFYGRFRQLAIKYNLQVPVCICAHPWHVHHSGDGNSDYYQRKFCTLMGIDRDKIILALNTRDFEYLEKISVHMEKRLDLLRV